jgi:endoglucanase
MFFRLIRPTKRTALLFALTLLFQVNAFCQVSKVILSAEQGAVVRGDSTQKNIFLVFTGDEYTEGLPVIIETLKSQNVKAGFFFTGRLYENKNVGESIKKLKSAGHYLGPHSDQHLLYNHWAKRDSVLVTQDSLITDIRTNYRKMEALGIRNDLKLFIPPFEWWSDEIVSWCNSEGIQVISFTRGINTHADYTYPEIGKSYKSSETIISKLFDREAKHGLNGFIILVHVGTDPRREDKLYARLGEVITELKKRGYVFKRVDEVFD